MAATDTGASEAAGSIDMIGTIENISNIIWSGTWEKTTIIPVPPMVVILLGAGLYIMIGLRFYPIRKLGSAFAGLFRGRKGEGSGEISPFAALSTALSGQVGTGNLAGVAGAIAIGGPGAIFWMWVTAIIGMALAFAEGSLAIRYRERTSEGTYRGGPMSYIVLGLGPKWAWLAVVFCLATLFSALITGNGIQANAVADSFNELFGMSERVAGVIVALAVFIVIIGGIKSIGRVAESVIPFMAITYIVMALIALLLNASAIPATFALIFKSAFSSTAAAGGFVGASFIIAIRAGVERGLFSNEAGQGSTPIAHAVAQSDDPASQGRFAMLGTFIDTVIVCTMTALVILTVQGQFALTGADGTQTMVNTVWTSDLGPERMAGFATTSTAFASVFPMEVFGIPLGALVASIVLILFVFTTLLTWSYYGERAITFLYDRIPGATEGGEKVLHLIWRVIWCVAIYFGSFAPLDTIWRLGGISNALMTIPNLLALLLLSGVVFKLAKGDKSAGEDHYAESGEERLEY
ncbi:MAG: sodium:alanine symporter family protein [Pseudomonadota bacterium]